MVVATGDGKLTEQGCSFTQQVIRAAKRGWKVEVWSWNTQLSKALRDTRLRFPENIKIIKLDEWYNSIVFLKGGTYFIDGENVIVHTRRCAGLNLTESAFVEATTLP
jgi:hypothetical protein